MNDEDKIIQDDVYASGNFSNKEENESYTLYLNKKTLDFIMAYDKVLEGEDEYIAINDDEMQKKVQKYHPFLKIKNGTVDIDEEAYNKHMSERR